MMKHKGLQKILYIIAIIMLISGLVLVMFPVVSNWYGKSVANSIADDFDYKLSHIEEGSFSDSADQKSSDGLSSDSADNENKNTKEDNKDTNYSYGTTVYYKTDLEQLYKDSVAYNEMLKTDQRKKLINEYAYEQPSLNLSKYGIFDGVYGYVTAPSIDMRLPIYLGANNEHMSYGAAHLSYTSLPIGGNSTNTVLAGHTGYVGRIFFDNIRKLKIGDLVSVRNFWSTIDYKVKETQIYTPKQSERMFLSENRDLLTLITCIDNGNGGFDRYYVICERK